MRLGCLRRDPPALSEDKLAAHRFTVAWNRYGGRRHQSDHGIQGGRPFIWNRIGAKRRRPGRFQQVAGKQHVRIGHHDNEVALGMPSTKVGDLQSPVILMSCGSFFAQRGEKMTYKRKQSTMLPES